MFDVIESPEINVFRLCSALWTGQLP